MTFSKRLMIYAELIRFHKPVGTILLLFPTLTALWIAQHGVPDFKTVVIFILGTFFMRSAGCALNDFADRKFDLHVERTQNRPLARQAIFPIEALLVSGFFLFLSLMLLAFCHPLTRLIAPFAAFSAMIYPFLKRIFVLPQLGLGVAFAFGVPMAFAEVQHQLPWSMWWIFLAGVVFPIMYDTQYACVDKKDDEKIHIYSSAILFGSYDLDVITILQMIFLLLQILIAILFSLSLYYYLGVALAGVLFMYQQYLMRVKQDYFKAFLNNQWVAMILFAGAVCHFHL